MHQNLMHLQGNQNSAHMNPQMNSTNHQGKRLITTSKLKKQQQEAPARMSKMQANMHSGDAVHDAGPAAHQSNLVKVADQKIFDSNGQAPGSIAGFGAVGLPEGRLASTAATLGQAKSSQSIIAGFVQTGTCDQSSTGATGGTSTSALQ